MQNWDVWANKPFIITEFYTKAEDSGLTNSPVPDGKYALRKTEEYITKTSS